MQDWYQIPALILSALLLPAFGRLYSRSRDTRTLLWFLAFVFATARLLLLYPTGAWEFNAGRDPWRAVLGQSFGLLSSGLFLGSLSPIRMRLGKRQVLYVIPYIAPMIAYAVLANGVFHGIAPSGPLFWIFPGLASVSLIVALFWDFEDGSLPTWIGTLACLVFGGLAMWFCLGGSLARPLVLADSGNHVVTALLVIYVFRRFSPGVAISFVGLMGWACPVLLSLHGISSKPGLTLGLVRLVVLSQVITAVGLILLALENEIAANQVKSERERRARLEMEAYTRLMLSRRRVEDFDRQADEICATIVEHSRFSQAALLLLQPSGRFSLAGEAGLDQATRKALEAFAGRISADRFPPPEFSRPAVNNSTTLEWDLQPWLAPGDDLGRLRFTSVRVIPMQGREVVEGALILSGMRKVYPPKPLIQEDLLPLEMLAGRLQAVRSQTALMEKLVDSEKFAGLGQLAGSVTQQLNNPLTVILGYASLLEETPQLGEHERRGVEAILSEARHMRSTLQSLSQIARSPAGPRAAVSVPEILKELEHLHRAEFLQRSIQFRLKIAPGIPRVLCNGQQLRQAVLHCLHFAMDAVDCQGAGAARSVGVEAFAEAGRVQITVAHSGPGFHHPERAFDPYAPAIGGLETSGLGLSLCATILRDNEGKASAVNLGSQGAAILLDLQAA